VIPDAPGVGLGEAIGRTFAEARASMERYRVHDALAAAMDLARLGNGYVEERQPWAQAKDPAGGAALDETLASLARTLVALAALFEPVAPSRMAELSRRLGFPRTPTLAEALEAPLAGRRVERGEPLFPRVEQA